MIDAPQLIAAMRQRRIKWLTVAQRIERSEADVMNWINGSSQIPAYIILTLDAVQHKLEPATVERMRFDDVATALGIEDSRVRFWKSTEQYPLAARLAITAYDAQREQKRHTLNIPASARLPTHQFRTLALIVQAERYWRVKGGWRARPTLGKAWPQLRLHTPDDLVRLGLVERKMVRMNVCIEATASGRAHYYKED